LSDHGLLQAKQLKPKNNKAREKIMKQIVAIALVGLLGSLGCSDSDDGTRAVTGEAIPVAPFGITDTTTPTYEWTPVPGATKYLLLVEDVDAAPVIEEWYTAGESGCESEDGLCSITPDIGVTGNTWKVRACAGEECGLWSDELQFSFTFGGPTPPRFTDNGDDTVTDNNTKLMWTKNANRGSETHDGTRSWFDAIGYCDGLQLAGHSDWRLPSLNELGSLIDEDQYNPALPPGNPFRHVQSVSYWLSTTYASLPINAWFVHLRNGFVFYGYKASHGYVWPVRSGN